MTLGIVHVQAGFAGILLSTEPLWIALLSVVVLKQKLTPPLLAGPLVRRFGALRVSAITLWIGTIPLVALSARGMLTAGDTLTATGWLVLFLYGLGPNLIGMLLWNFGLSRVPGTRAALLLNLYPVVSVAGGTIVVLGLVLSQDNFLSRRLFPRPMVPQNRI
jgi:drug/metabolite transporter (DMT)-like permease